MPDLKFFSSLLNLEISEFKKLKGGINSSIYKLKSQNKYFVIKFYPNKKKDCRPRISTEIEFLKRLNKLNVKNVPKILDFSIQDNWALLTFLEGEKLNYLNSQNVKEIMIFVRKMQSIKKEKKIIIELGEASEACFSISDHFKLVEEKVFLLIQNIDNFSNDKINDLKNYLNYELSTLKKVINNNSQKKIAPIIIISPSDIGIHNMIKKENKLYFLDFEYGGEDDAYKLLSDLIIQPNFIFSHDLKEEVVNAFNTELNVKIDESRLKILIALYRLKWCFIINKKIFNSSKNFKFTEYSIKKYLAETKIWGFNNFSII